MFLNESHKSGEAQRKNKITLRFGSRPWNRIRGGVRTGPATVLTTGASEDCCRDNCSDNCPSLKKGRWTQEEDDILIDCQLKWGNSWTKISTLLPGRSDNAVKNRWKALERQTKHVFVQKSDHAQPQKRRNHVREKAISEETSNRSTKSSLSSALDTLGETFSAGRTDKAHIVIDTEQSLKPSQLDATAEVVCGALSDCSKESWKTKKKKESHETTGPPNKKARQFKTTEEARRHRALTRPSRSKTAIEAREREKARQRTEETEFLKDLFAKPLSEHETSLVRQAYSLGISKVMKGSKNSTSGSVEIDSSETVSPSIKSMQWEFFDQNRSDYIHEQSIVELDFSSELLSSYPV